MKDMQNTELAFTCPHPLGKYSQTRFSPFCWEQLTQPTFIHRFIYLTQKQIASGVWPTFRSWFWSFIMVFICVSSSLSFNQGRCQNLGTRFGFSTKPKSSSSISKTTAAARLATNCFFFLTPSILDWCAPLTQGGSTSAYFSVWSSDGSDGSPIAR